MTRRPATSIVSNPVLVGAIAILVAVVAVYITYNANNGLPFVPSTRVVLQLENGVTVGPDSEIREGGHRIGVVEKVRLGRLPDGRAGAEAVLKIDRSAGEIPADSTFAVRLKGAIGGKYIELNRGRSPRKFAEGAVVHPDHIRLPVELDDILSAFDAPTRAGQRRVLRGIGGALADRGPALNATVSRLPDLLGSLQPVMAALAAPSTRLDRAVRATATVTAALAPVAAAQADALASVAATFAALSADRGAYQDTIAEVARTVTQGTPDLRTVRPVVERAALLVDDLRATARTLRRALPTVNEALETSAGPLRRSATLGDELQGTLRAAGRLAGDPLSTGALRGLTTTTRSLQTQLRFYGPHVTVCNVVNLWTTFVTDVISSRSPNGTAQLGMPEIAFPQDDGVGVMGANEVATGRGSLPGTSPQHLHADAFSQAIEKDGRADCELGQQGYLHSGNANDDTPDRYYRRAVLDAHSPPGGAGDGPTYKRYDSFGRGIGLGPARLPAGQTGRRHPGGKAFPDASEGK